MKVHKSKAKKVSDYLDEHLELYKKWGRTEEEFEKSYELMIVLGMSPRAFHCLKRSGITTVEELKEFYYQNGDFGLLGLRNVGQKTAQEIKNGMTRNNIELKTIQENDCDYCYRETDSQITRRKILECIDYITETLGETLITAEDVLDYLDCEGEAE